MKTSTAFDITAGLENAAFLNVGDTVVDTHNNEGEVLGFSAEGHVVALFESGERVIDLSEESLLKKTANSLRPWAEVKMVKKATRIPLDKAEKMGFKHIVADRYQFQPVATTVLANYPWQVASCWKIVADGKGKKFLVKEEDTGNEGNTPKHQLDSDGTEPGNSTDTFNIFD